MKDLIYATILAIPVGLLFGFVAAGFGLILGISDPSINKLTRRGRY